MISKAGFEDENLLNMLHSMEMIFPQLSASNKLRVILGVGKLRRTLTNMHFNTFLDDMFLNNHFLKLLVEEKIDLLKLMISMKKTENNHVKFL